MEENILPQEQQEYMAYKNWKDVINNLEKGIHDLDYVPDAFQSNNKVLICGAMIAFDKGLSNFLNTWYFYQKDLILLSEVTAQYRRYTKERMKIPFICTPHMLAKEMVIHQMSIPVSNDMIDQISCKNYLQEAVENMSVRYMDLGNGYSIAWCYYAYKYIKKLLLIAKPRCVVLWNEFYTFHTIFKGICQEMNIPLRYMEFGCIPGTICLEEYGQQGESLVTKKYKQFNKKIISSEEMEYADKVINYLFRTRLNRNKQPNAYIEYQKLTKYVSGRQTIVYIGQNDYEAGICPYSKKTRRDHSPIFEDTLEALEYLALMCIKNNWNLVFKPHPMMEILKHNEYQHLNSISVVSNVDINSVVDFADVIVTLFSQVAYISLIRNTPVVLMGYMQLTGKKCTYEVYKKHKIEKMLRKAVCIGYTKEQRKYFVKHVAQLLKYYLYDDLTKKEIQFGQKISSILI